MLGAWPQTYGIVDMKNNWPSPIQKRGLKKTAPNSSGWGSVIKGHKKQSSVYSRVFTFDEATFEGDEESYQREIKRLYVAVMDHDEIVRRG